MLPAVGERCAVSAAAADAATAHTRTHARATLPQACLDNYKQQLVGDPIIHTHLTALYGEPLGTRMSRCAACSKAL
jgi:hypothetical protein